MSRKPPPFVTRPRPLTFVLSGILFGAGLGFWHYFRTQRLGFALLTASVSGLVWGYWMFRSKKRRYAAHQDKQSRTFD